MKLYVVTIEDTCIEAGSNPKPEIIYFTNKREAEIFMDGFNKVKQKSQKISVQEKETYV